MYSIYLASESIIFNLCRWWFVQFTVRISVYIVFFIKQRSPLTAVLAHPTMTWSSLVLAVYARYHRNAQDSIAIVSLLPLHSKNGKVFEDILNAPVADKLCIVQQEA